jgi:hypothetical protein
MHSSVHRFTLEVTTDTLGSANFKSLSPLHGEILSVRLDGTALNLNGTADFLLRKSDDRGTILALSDFTSPWEIQPRQTLHTISGGSALPASGTGIPVDGYLECIVGSAKPSASAVVHVYYRD